MDKPKRILFSVTRDDCDWQAFRAGGPGGQHQNKVSSAVRCIHRASGAVGESRSERSQHINKQIAFRHMCESLKFKIWHKIETARRLGRKSIDEIVDESMAVKNIKVEIRSDSGWTETVSMAE